MTVTNQHHRLQWGFTQGLKPMPMTYTAMDVSDEGAIYAQEVQDAIHGLMRKYARSVGFESQMAIIGVAIGAMLAQLDPLERDHFTRILLTNLEDAPKLSTIMHYH